MKKLLPFALALCTSAAIAQDIQFNDLTKKDVENVSREFAGNFAHTGVSAPETDGLWGVEVGVIGGQSKSPDLKDVVEDSGGKGSDFKNLYHAGLQVRGHFPFDIFAEITLLPEREIEDVKVKNQTFELGWNAGAFFNLPLDLAVGINRANSEISFKQKQPVDNKVELESKTTIMWIGVSKTFLFVTPYVKFGRVQSDSELQAKTTGIFRDLAQKKEDVENDGGYFALGANLQFAFFKLGAEISKVMDVDRATAKISFDF